MTLFFDKPKPHPVVFFFRLIDGVRLILAPESLQSLESQGRISSAYYISVPDVRLEDREFWEKTRKRHPEFAKLLRKEP